MSNMSEVHRFLCRVFENDSEVIQPQNAATRFGSRGFKVEGRVFAMEWDGALALKLPTHRVLTLVAQGNCAALDMGGRKMREWIVVHDRTLWPALTQEARQFVGAIGKASS